MRATRPYLRQRRLASREHRGADRRRADAGQRLSEFLVVGGLVGLVAVLVGRGSLRRLKVGLAVAAMLAVIAPLVSTDWDTYRARQHFEQVAAPAGWTPSCYTKVDLTDHGRFAGRAFVRSYDFEDSGAAPTSDDLLAFYRGKLPGFRCHDDRELEQISCNDGRSELDASYASAGGGPLDSLHVELTTCGEGRDPHLPDATDGGPMLPCGADQNALDQL